MVFYKKQTTYNPQFTTGVPYDKGKAVRDTEAYGKQTKAVHVKDTEGKRYPRSVLYFKTAEGEGVKVIECESIRVCECVSVKV